MDSINRFVIIYTIISLCSSWIADFYNELRLIDLLPIVLLELLFYGIGKLYETVLHKELMFRVIAVRNIVSSLLSLVLAIVLALCDYGVYSLILSILFNAILLNIWNLLIGQRRIKLKLFYPVNKYGL